MIRGLFDWRLRIWDWRRKGRISCPLESIIGVHFWFLAHPVFAFFAHFAVERSWFVARTGLPSPIRRRAGIAREWESRIRVNLRESASESSLSAFISDFKVGRGRLPLPIGSRAGLLRRSQRHGRIRVHPG